MDAGNHRPGKASDEGVMNANIVDIPPWSLDSGVSCRNDGVAGFWFGSSSLAWMPGTIVQGRRVLRCGEGGYCALPLPGHWIPALSAGMTWFWCVAQCSSSWHGCRDPVHRDDE